MNKKLNIMIAINENYLEICKTMLFSLFKYNKQNNIDIYLLNKSLNKSKVKDLFDFVGNLGGNLIQINILESVLPELPIVMNRFSIEMYYRIIAYKLLPNNLDRILWLDSDIIINGSLDGFYNQNFNDKYLVVCKDFYDTEEEIKIIKKKMDISDNHKYFNSGVILFNLDRIRSNIQESYIFNCLDKYKNKLTYPDQDILNHIYQENVKYDDEYIFNFQVNNLYTISNDKLKSVVIIHYSGFRKPWDLRRARPVSKSYWKIEFERKKYFKVITFSLGYLALYIPKEIKMILKGNKNDKSSY